MIYMCLYVCLCVSRKTDTGHFTLTHYFCVQEATLGAIATLRHFIYMCVYRFLYVCVCFTAESYTV